MFIFSIQFYAQHREKKSSKIVSSLSFSSGLVNTNLSWNISGNLAGENPNVLSELIWENVIGINFSGNYEAWYKRVGVSINYANTSYFKGNATDTDYLKDNRTEISFFSELNAKESTSNQQELKAKYKIIDKEKTKVILSLGYVLINQTFRLRDEGSLNSFYQPKWQGVLIGAKTIFRYKRVSLCPYINYSQLDYTAKADWNLITNFKHPISFEHFANGFGLKAGFMFELKTFKNINFTLNYFHQYLSTGKGTENLYLIDNSIKKTRVNDITSKAHFLTIGARIHI